jgi:hypothetical protein
MRNPFSFKTSFTVEQRISYFIKELFGVFGDVRQEKEFEIK